MFLKTSIKILIYLFSLIFSTQLYSQITVSEQKEQIQKSIYVSDINTVEKLQRKQNMIVLKKNCLSDNSIQSRYFQVILNMMLSNSTGILPDKYLLNGNYVPDSFCVLVGINNNVPAIGFQSSFEGVILANLNVNFLSFYSEAFRRDADYAVAISHELAHSILNHQEEIMDFRIKSEQQNITLSPKNPKYLARLRQQEIEADNLGLNLYLNAGFNADNFGDFFLRLDQITLYNRGKIRDDVPKTRWNAFKRYADLHTCVNLGLSHYNATYVSKRDPNAFSSFMGSIKYLNPDIDIHPSGCFRYWNAFIQRRQLERKRSTNSILNFMYLKLKLYSYKNLPVIKEKLDPNFNSKTSVDPSIKTDPRLIVINDLLNSDTEIPMELYQSTEENLPVGIVQKDKSLLLRASNIITLLSFQMNGLNEDTLNVHRSSVCTAYFNKQISKQDYSNSIINLRQLQEYRNLSIKKAFL